MATTTARTSRHLTLLATALLAAGCSLHGTATRWNGRVGLDGDPVFVCSTTNIGVNLGIVLPLLGSTTMETMVDTTTGKIAENDGNRVRIIETTSENYWYGFPPFTWILTPVITTVSIEYVPSEKERQEVEALHAEQAGNSKQRQEQDNSRVVPDGSKRR